MSYIIHTIYAVVKDDGSWDIEGYYASLRDHYAAIKQVHVMRQRSDVLACEHSIYIKEGEKR